MDERHEIENLRRSLAMGPPDARASAITNRRAVQVINRLQVLEGFRTAVTDVIGYHRPSGDNPQLVAALEDLARAVNDTVD